jgi:hypothetical protein
MTFSLQILTVMASLMLSRTKLEQIGQILTPTAVE